MNNKDYWRKRANARMDKYLSRTADVQKEINAAYAKSNEYIQGEINKIFKNYQNATGISKAQVKNLLKITPEQGEIKRIKSIIDNITDPVQKSQMLAIINSPTYKYRIERLERLQQDITARCNKLYGTRLSATSSLLSDTAQDAYMRTMFDMQLGTGLGFSFSQMPTSRINAILKYNWSGEHFSSRIWNSTSKLAASLKQQLLVGFMTGKSGRKLAAEIAQTHSVSYRNANRLVRTEMNYVANQAELESYKECGVERYEFLATLDSRTSRICQELDGKTFAVKDGQPGENMPPMHPNCRSTTIAVVDEGVTEELERRARNSNGTTETVPANMNYEEWQKKYVDNGGGSGIIKARRDGALESTIWKKQRHTG